MLLFSLFLSFLLFSSLFTHLHFLQWKLRQSIWSWQIKNKGIQIYKVGRQSIKVENYDKVYNMELKYKINIRNIFIFVKSTLY